MFIIFVCVVTVVGRMKQQQKRQRMFAAQPSYHMSPMLVPSYFPQIQMPLSVASAPPATHVIPSDPIYTQHPTVCLDEAWSSNMNSIRAFQSQMYQTRRPLEMRVIFMCTIFHQMQMMHSCTRYSHDMGLYRV